MQLKILDAVPRNVRQTEATQIQVVHTPQVATEPRPLTASDMPSSATTIDVPGFATGPSPATPPRRRRTCSDPRSGRQRRTSRPRTGGDTCQLRTKCSGDCTSCAAPGDVNHRHGQVDTDNFASRPDATAQKRQICPCTHCDFQHPAPRAHSPAAPPCAAAPPAPNSQSKGSAI